MVEKIRHTVTPRVMCFVFNKDKLLMIKASSKKDWAGTYDPVGGHIEKGESIIEAAKREIWEETGLRVQEVKLKGIVHVSNFFGKNVMLFITTAYSDEVKVKNNDEGTLEWLEKSDLESIKVFEDVKPMIEQIQTLSENEIFVGTSEFDGKDKLLSFNIAIN